MRFIRAAAILVAALAALSGYANANPVDDYQAVLFQPRTIFHSSLMHTHTIALTFDDGPNRNTPAVLDALKAWNVKATFFVVGRNARRFPDILARIAAEGHLLANHSTTHPVLGTRFDRHPELLIDQIRGVHDMIAPLMQPTDGLFFRAPYGVWRKAHADILNADPELRNYVGPIYWDEGGETTVSDDGYVLTSADWSCWRRHWTAETCAKGYRREIERHDGGVVLMHCVQAPSGDLVAAVLPGLMRDGFRFVRLDGVPAYRRYQAPPNATTSEKTGTVLLPVALRRK